MPLLNQCPYCRTLIRADDGLDGERDLSAGCGGVLFQPGGPAPRAVGIVNVRDETLALPPTEGEPTKRGGWWGANPSFEWPTTVVESWEDFEKVVDEIKKANAPLADTEHLSFRGQANAAWSMKSSILRQFGEVSDDFIPRALSIELELLNWFSTGQWGRAIQVTHEGLIKTWSDMQHYRAPTRLLDWTYSPLVAAYFAVGKAVHNGEEQPGAVFFVDNAILGGMAEFNYAHHKVPAGSEISPPDLFQTDPNSRRLLTIGRYPPSNKRMTAQQGHFIYSTYLLDNHEEAIRGLMLNFHTFGKKHLAKIVIPGGLKTTFLQKLHQKGISALSMFLAPDGLGQMVEEVMRLCLDNKAPANPDDVFLRRVYT